MNVVIGNATLQRANTIINDDFNNGTSQIYESYSSLLFKLPDIITKAQQDFGLEVMNLSEKFGMARSTYKYLFLQWMPLGYAGIIPVNDDQILAATMAMLNYGIAVTLIDDVIDENELDKYCGIDFSKKTSTWLSHSISNNKSRYQLSDKFSTLENHFIYQVTKHIRRFFSYAESLPSYYVMSPYIAQVQNIFSRQMLLCRKSTSTGGKK